MRSRIRWTIVQGCILVLAICAPNLANYSPADSESASSPSCLVEELCSDLGEDHELPGLLPESNARLDRYCFVEWVDRTTGDGHHGILRRDRCRHTGTAPPFLLLGFVVA